MQLSTSNKKEIIQYLIDQVENDRIDYEKLANSVEPVELIKTVATNLTATMKQNTLSVVVKHNSLKTTIKRNDLRVTIIKDTDV